MSTKEDILEQVVEEYLIHKGYFVQHNVKFKPRKDHPSFVSRQDSNHSDIDVIGYNPDPEISGARKVMAVSCKSWQNGFSPSDIIDRITNQKKLNGKEAWKTFRELACPKWSEAFVKAIQDATGSDQFTYVTAITRLIGDKSTWEAHQPFLDVLSGNPIQILTFHEMVTEIQDKLTTTLAATEIGRMLQLFKAANMQFTDG